MSELSEEQNNDTRKQVERQLYQWCKNLNDRLSKMYHKEQIDTTSADSVITEIFGDVYIPPVTFIPGSARRQVYHLLKIPITDSLIPNRNSANTPKVRGFYEAASKAVFVFRDRKDFGVWEPFVSQRLAVHEKTHSLDPEDVRVTLPGEKYRPGNWRLNMVYSDGKRSCELRVPKSGFIITNTTKDGASKGTFFDEGISEYVASRWTRQQFMTGKIPGFIDVAQRDGLIGVPLTEIDSIWLETKDEKENKYPIPASFFIPKANGSLGFSVQTLAGACFWMLAQRDDQFIKVAAKAKMGDVEQLREFPRRINHLLGKDAHVYLRDCPDNLEGFAERYRFVKQQLGY